MKNGSPSSACTPRARDAVAPGARAGADRREGRRVREARHRERRTSASDAVGVVARWFLPRRGGREKRGAYRDTSDDAIRR